MTIEKPKLDIVVFEDEAATLRKIQSQLDQINANIVAEAQSLPQAFGVLERLAHRDLSADVVLLDGNLDYTAGERPVFDIRLPLSPEEIAKKGVLGRWKAKKGERIVVDPVDYGVIARDARVILEIMRRTKIASKVIGISRDKLSDYGMAIDIDLTKSNIDQLAARLLDI